MRQLGVGGIFLASRLGVKELEQSKESEEEG